MGSVDRAAAVKALSTWIDLGVLKEEPENTFILLEHEEEGQAASTRVRGTAQTGTFTRSLSQIGYSLSLCSSFDRGARSLRSTGANCRPDACLLEGLIHFY